MTAEISPPPEQPDRAAGAALAAAGESKAAAQTAAAAAAVPRGLTVRAWFLLAVTVLGVMTAAAAMVGVTVLSRTTDATNRLVNIVAPARTESFQLQAALLDQETGVRGYLLSGDLTLLEPYERGKGAERTARQRLEPLIAGSAEDTEALTAVDAAVKSWREGFAVPAVAAKDSEAPAVSIARGKATFDQVRTRLSTLHSRLLADQTHAQSDLRAARTQRDRAFTGVLILLILTGVGVVVLLRYTVVRPLETVRTAAWIVADGDFEHPIPAHGPADLRALAGAVEGMRLRVVGELTVARRREAVLAEQTAELDAQASELRRSNSELEQFAYVASHDLQEPLRKVASFCQLLQKRYGDELDARAVTYIDFAVDGAKRMQILINDLLTFSRVGRLNDSYDAVDLDTVFERGLRNVALAWEEQGGTVDRPQDLPTVMGDPTLLTMLWQNLLGNAVKFRRPDRAPHVEVTVEPDEEPGFLRFSVADNGIGIAPEFAEKVFVIFQRLHSRDAYDGTGIGLSLCRKIVEHSGGRIWIDTEYTDGARLVFTLPAAGTGTTTPNEPEAESAPQGATP
ncbi:sensor histidine kinase [Streptomyces beijiangensis]|uniref:histidine kinase n=1 Tax=Streptomyces beijiangensis TaxID=163361 RepID=A0A939FFE5_9ACTN|nr:sensor histidine kinase [Streptomyces beijiangensis]MBO0517104.1 CHASE3 domain-containing protein [Streptomyces beijiangensis]